MEKARELTKSLSDQCPYQGPVSTRVLIIEVVRMPGLGAEIFALPPKLSYVQTSASARKPDPGS